jgi:UDP-N-acetylmuramoyl-tripeptide--D-alanyl-D-alanine ligase
MLRAGFGALGRVHASEKSYNNHWGVPLTLARMPADTDFAVLEIGMNHPGEIRPLSKLARPHVAVITTIAPAHLGAFASVEEIADAKAEIFEGLEPGGVAVLPRDNPRYFRLERAGRNLGAHVLTFGFYGDDAQLQVYEGARQNPLENQIVYAKIGSNIISYELAFPGEHMALNSLAALLSIKAGGGNIQRAAEKLGILTNESGRGQRAVLRFADGEALLVDESYNANPASVAAALETLALYPRERRRIAVLGDMFELGPASDDLHRVLKRDIDRAGVDQVFACGPKMKLLFDTLAATQKGDWRPTSAELEPLLLAAVKPGDVVMIKGSNGMGMARLVKALRALGAADAAGRG